MKQVEDYSDALTFLSTLHQVESDCIGFWGMSFSGTIALCSAALDKRAKFVIAICPLLSFDFAGDRFPKVLVKATKDRELQITGNPPFYMPLLTEKGENPAGFGIGMDKEAAYRSRQRASECSQRRGVPICHGSASQLDFGRIGMKIDVQSCIYWHDNLLLIPLANKREQHLLWCMV